MLKSFSITNYTCYSEPVNFEFDCNIGIIFGSNASGKTNALKALRDSISLISKRPDNSDSPIALWSPNNKNKPVELSLIFKLENNDEEFEYALSVFENKVIEEKFFSCSSKEVVFSFSNKNIENPPNWWVLSFRINKYRVTKKILISQQKPRRVKSANQQQIVWYI